MRTYWPFLVFIWVLMLVALIAYCSPVLRRYRYLSPPAGRETQETTPRGRMMTNDERKWLGFAIICFFIGYGIANVFANGYYQVLGSGLGICLTILARDYYVRRHCRLNGGQSHVCTEVCKKQ
jgi:hypothetical protein